MLLDYRQEKNGKQEAISELNRLAAYVGNGLESMRNDLVQVQNRFLELSLPPSMGESWVNMQIVERWQQLFEEAQTNNNDRQEVWEAVGRLKKSLRYGLEPEVIQSYDKLPEAVKKEWVDLLYTKNSRFDSSALGRLIEILEDPSLDIPSKERSRKSLIQLKALAETMNALERNTNFLLRQVLNGKEIPCASSTTGVNSDSPPWNEAAGG
jgi:hypothetical protein